MNKLKEWWRGGVIYQIYPRSFYDSNGDGIGDLRGISEKIDYLASLGVDALWLSPFFKSPMEDFGYDISDYYSVDPIFGSMEDFEVLISLAHKKNLKVIIDQVISHTASVHPWFIESRKNRINAKADWYVWSDPQADGTPPNNWLSIFGGSAWEWDARRLQYYLHNFLKTQPDLNFHNLEVQGAVLDVLKFWLDKGVDGFRLDTVNFYYHDKSLRSNPALPAGSNFLTAPKTNPYSYQQHLYDKTQPENLVFLSKVRKLLDQYNNKMLVGELGVDGDKVPETLRAYTERDKRLHMAYVFELLTSEFSAKHIRTVVERLTKEIQGGWICWSFSNHDVERVITRWGLVNESSQAGPLLWALLLSLRGSACVYQGEELALTESSIPYELLQDPYGKVLWPEFKGRDGCRTPIPWSRDKKNAGFTTGLPWLPVDNNHLNLAVDVQSFDKFSPLSICQQFSSWRNNYELLKTGEIEFFDYPEPILAFRRYQDTSSLLALFNLGKDVVKVTLPVGNWKSLSGYGFINKKIGSELELPGFSAYFASSCN